MKLSVKSSCAVLLLVALSLCFTGLAMAQSSKKDINKSQAAKRAQQTVKGRVLKVDKRKNNYRVKMLKKSGRVVSVNVDKRSGQVSSKKRTKSKKDHR